MSVTLEFIRVGNDIDTYLFHFIVVPEHGEIAQCRSHKLISPEMCPHYLAGWHFQRPVALEARFCQHQLQGGDILATFIIVSEQPAVYIRQ